MIERGAELQDVGDVRAPERVDRLVGVADDEHVAGGPAQQPDQPHLRQIRVLVLVDQDVFEALPVVLGHLVVSAEQLHAQHQQVVEVHGAGASHPLLVLGVDPGHIAIERAAAIGRVDQLRCAGRRRELILHGRDRRVDRALVVSLRIEIEVAHHIAGEASRVGLVIDAERGGVAQHFGVAAQDPGARTVKRGDPHPLRHRADEAADAIAHLPRRLVGERDRQQAERADVAVSEQVGDAVAQHACLARPGPGHHERRTVAVQHGSSLTRVQRRKDRVVARTHGCRLMGGSSKREGHVQRITSCSRR